MFKLELQKVRSVKCLVCGDQINVGKRVVRFFHKARGSSGEYPVASTHEDCVSQVMSAIIDNYEGAR